MSIKLMHRFLLFLCVGTLAGPAFAAEDDIAALDRYLANGDRLLEAGKPVEAIRKWRGIWDLQTATLDGVGRQLRSFERYVDAYQTMGPEGLEVAADYLAPIAKHSVESLQAPRFLRLGDILWKINRRSEAAVAYQRVLELQPAHPEAPRLKERIASAAASARDANDIAGTRISPPRAVPAECIDPTATRTYALDGGRLLCVAFNEFAEEPGYWSPRQSLGGKANLTITIEGAPSPQQAEDALPITVYLKDASTWRRVLKSRGFAFRFVAAAGHDLPNLEIKWDPTGEAPEEMRPIIGERHSLTTVFTWNGKGYSDAAIPAAQRLNAKALAKLGKKDLAGALTLWREAMNLSLIPGASLPASPEILNNYGFALVKKSSYQAETFLRYALSLDPARWQAHLNLGDLLWDQGHFDQAIESYRAVISLNPSYRRAQNLRDRIRQKENAIGGLKEDAAPQEMETKGQGDLACGGVTFPTAAEYARKVGLDPDQIAAALKLRARDDHDLLETTSFGSERYQSNCFSQKLRVMETLAFSTGRGKFAAVLYWGAAPKGAEPQWHLAILSRGYQVEKVMPLFEAKNVPVQETSTAHTDLMVDSGRIIAKVISTERGTPSVTRQLIVQPAADGKFEVVSSKKWEDEED